MALKAKPKLKAGGKAPTPKAVELTIEQVREKYLPGTFELAVGELKELMRIGEVAKEHANAANRQGTVAKKAFKLYAQAAELKPADELHVGPNAYRYDVAYAEKIDAAELYAMVKAGKISEAQFLGVINVAKGPAGHLIGAHVLATMTHTTPGKEFDIRRADLDTPVVEPKLVRKSAPPKPKNKLRTEVEQAPAKITGGIGKVKKLRRIRA